jgi:predicted Zn-dependent peptidase
MNRAARRKLIQQMRNALAAGLTLEQWQALEKRVRDQTKRDLQRAARRRRGIA